MKALSCVWTIALCACGGHPSDPARSMTTEPTTRAPSAELANAATPVVVELPTADADRFVVPASRVPHPAAIVWIDAKGAVAVSHTGPRWTGELPTAPHVVVDTPGDTGALERTILQAAVADHGAASDASAQQLALLDDPPPPDEDNPDDESGGTGTAMALDEGRMGQRDPARTPEQYKMHPLSEDQQAARAQAIEQARAAGILGPHHVARNEVYGRTVAGSVAPLADDRAKPLIVAAPGASAYLTARIASRVGGVIAVRHAGKLAALDAAYAPSMPQNQGFAVQPWIEIYLESSGVRLVRMPQLAPIAVASKAGAVDRDALVAAFQQLRAIGDHDEPVDVLVAAQGGTTQELVDVLVTVNGAAPSAVSIGDLRGTVDERIAKLKRGYALAFPVVRVGQPSVVGDLDKAVIRTNVKQSLPRLQACYEQRLRANPKLAGTVQVQFFIAPSGKVVASSAAGVDPQVASCVAGVIKKIGFPKPKGGGGVQVNYPFTFRPPGP
jgi:hypothetical protein